MPPDEHAAAFASALDAAGLEAVRISLPTGWPVGPVAAFLLPGTRVTLVDSGVDSEQSREALVAGLQAHGLGVADIEQVIVTHGHGDHFGGALAIQRASGCRVFLHAMDAERLGGGFDWAGLLVQLGVDRTDAERTVRRRDRELPEFTELQGGEVIPAGRGALLVHHHPGHTPGHVLLQDQDSGVLFSGDYLLASEAANPGLDLDPDSPMGRRPMVRLLDEGLQSIIDLDPPAALPSHGPPIVRPAELAGRRLVQSARRTERTLRALREHGMCTAYALALRMFGKRITRNLFEFLADSAGRLDLLVHQGRAEARITDGVWYFKARDLPQG